MGKDSDSKKDRDSSKKDSKKRERSSDRDKERDEDREKRKEKKDKGREKEKERDKARSRSRDKHRTSERDSDRKPNRLDERDRNRDIDRRGRSRSREKDEKRRSDGKGRASSRSERRHRQSNSRSRSASKPSDEEKPTKKSKADVATSSQPSSSTTVAPSVTTASGGNQLSEEELQKRRERVRLWQEAKAKSAGATAEVPTSSTEPTKATDPIPAEEPTISLDDYIPLRLKLAAAAAAEAENNMSEENQPPASEAEEEPAAEPEEKPVGWSLEDEDEDENDAAEKANVSELVVGTASLDQYETQLPLVSEQTLTAAATGATSVAAATTTATSIHSKSAEEEAAGSVFSAGGLRKKKKISRWENSDPITPTNAALAVKKTAPVVLPIVPLPVDDVDPLDEFMTGLYSAGDVETQKELVPTAAKPSNAMMPPPSGKPEFVRPSPVAEEEFDEEKIFYGSSSKVNPFGTNYITMEDILGSIGGGGGDLTDPASNGSAPSSSASKRRKPSGWESDALGDDEDAMDTGSLSDKLWQFGQGDELPAPEETEEEREAREEREKREFIDAIRRAREEEEAARQKLRELDSQRASEAATAAAKKETMGRVFAGEGDIVDEVEVLEKKKSALELLEEAKRGKMLKEIDHSKIEYMPFRKNLYIVPKALSRLTELEAQEKREDLHIKVRGRGCPTPVDTWEQCGLSDRILQIIQRHNLKEPFPIQKQAIPAIMCGRDVIGVAKTGSGKTLAFLLPMFRHIQDQPPLGDNEGPVGIVLAPARELALQISSEAKKFTKILGMRVACIYGGAGVAEQIADLKRGSDIVVCTPGRMIDILCMQAGRLISLRRVTMVVMDEADRMFDMGFEPQIKMIMQNVRPDRQTVLFSATFPKQIEKLAKTVLKFPLEIIVGERSTVNKDITQFVEVLEEEDKFLRLLQLLGLWYEKGSVLIFVDKQEKCDQLFQDLLKFSYPCLSLHGGKDQVDRDHTLNEFKTGVKTVMVATSVAGRGLDVPEIVCVVNYNCPNHLEDYVHRVGRTGRAGRKGTAYTFISLKEEQYAPVMVKVIEKAGQTPVPPELLEMSKQFKSKVAKGEAHWSSSGFVGKGFTFDSNEMNETQKIASMQRRAYEIDQGMVVDKAAGAIDDEEFADDEDDKGLKAGGAGAASQGGASSTLTSALEKAKQLASSLQGGTGQAPAGAVKIDANAAMAKARYIAEQMEFISRNPGMQVGLAAGASYFAEELEINDYPFQARRKVTNRQAMDDITERTGVAIISRGVFIEPGKKPQPGERKLHMVIEGASEMSVRQARMEIQRALDEETIRIGASVSSGIGLGALAGGSSGRYSVL